MDGFEFTKELRDANYMTNIINQRKLVINDVVLSYDEFTLSKANQIFDLPKKEFLQLYKLLSFQNKIFTRQELMDEIWGLETEPDLRTVDVHIKRIRKKFKNFSEFDIVTIEVLDIKEKAMKIKEQK